MAITDDYKEINYKVSIVQYPQRIFTDPFLKQ